MSVQTLDPMPRIRRQFSPVADPRANPPRADETVFVDPDDDEDCRAGLQEFDGRDDDEDEKDR